MLEKLSPWFILLIILSIIGEAIYSRRSAKDLYDRKDTITSVGLGILGVVTRFLLKGLHLLFFFFLFELSPLKVGRGPLAILMLFVLNELIYYWFHRISHEVRFFWATHVNHHSSTRMNFAVAARTPFLNAIYHILFWVPLPLLGFHPVDILVVETLSFFFAFVQHTTIIPKLGFLEFFLNTPSHHRVHHAMNEQYLDKNYGNVLIIFDRIFGTFQKEEEAPVYGITKNPIDRSFVNMIFHEWRELVKTYTKSG